MRGEETPLPKQSRQIFRIEEGTKTNTENEVIKNLKIRWYKKLCKCNHSNRNGLSYC